ncbi:MAG TPA: hypothetical protein PLD03_01935, partial [Thiomonas arsenitoxydans]|nr:hypothetical protein [Thiomonas arsenitoxydans]
GLDDAARFALPVDSLPAIGATRISFVPQHCCAPLRYFHIIFDVCFGSINVVFIIFDELNESGF